MLATILLATDGSAHARRATRLAADLARRYGARVIVVTAFDPIPRDLGSPYQEDLMARRTASAEAVAKDAGRVLDEVGVSHEEEVLEGPAADAILRVARVRGCDLIVMGSRGLSPLRAAILGSVSQRVVAEAPCPVLIVH
ncbi:MAG: universal stress protein [Armatimonadota bacterium]|nr:universal stress protein [Armatimonadota bacterium]MDR7402207.1 universal stress protein [Armatimonadota bacterium]MDR7403335.1 universal stress protein [Armatimonadota bacterium]MDR7436963.1 universal stress protein [Armatimonadota bacterium]MDR7506778.1 universal stress protein [Armatimonadota bacterium]